MIFVKFAHKPDVKKVKMINMYPMDFEEFLITNENYNYKN